MPNVTLNRDHLFTLLEEKFDPNLMPNKKSQIADKAFDELCFEFGIELDDVTSEKEVQQKETGAVDSNASDDILYVIAIPANRYDLLCMEGIVRALRVFMGKTKPAVFELSKPTSPLQQLIVKKETASVRPIIVCAILRNITFDQKRYKSFIDLQEKLHVNICRRRTLVSIGTHDLDTLQGPFTYEALTPKDIKFAPLNNTTEMNAEELMTHLDKDGGHLKPYLPIIRDLPRYPVIYDSKRQVLSLPPIINSNHSKITLQTRNVFIEVTATDRTKANIVLNTMCAMFSEYCNDQFKIEPVEITEADGKKIITPDLTQRPVQSTVDYINSGLGLSMKPDELVNILKKMSLTTSISDDKKSITVDVPITRSDIIHACDVMEDVGIAYGYKNLNQSVPQTFTFAKQQPLNKLTDQLRREMAMAGFTEALSLSLCSKQENYGNFLHKDDGASVALANPQSIEFEIVRTTLLVGLLKMIAHNRAAPLPLKIFETSDIVLKSDQTDVGSRNERRLAAVYSDKISGFEVINGLLDRVMQLNRVQWKDANKPAPKGDYYYLKASEDPMFFKGRGADIYMNDRKVGVIGVVHPSVLGNFKIEFPCSVLEITTEQFV